MIDLNLAEFIRFVLKLDRTLTKGEKNPKKIFLVEKKRKIHTHVHTRENTR